MEAEPEADLEEECVPGFSPSPDSEAETEGDDEPDQFFLQELHELEQEDAAEVVSVAEKDRRLSILGFEAAQLLTELKEGPPVDLHSSFSSSDSESDIPIGQLRSDYFRERIPIHKQQRKKPPAKKPPAKKPQKAPRKQKDPIVDNEAGVENEASLPGRPLVQPDMRGGKKKSKKLMTRDELRAEERLLGWEPIGPEEEPLFHAPVFTGPVPGPVRPPDLMGEFTELQAFRLFFSDEMLDLVVRHTNKYAKQRGAHIRERGHSRIWKDLVKEELLAFLGILLWTGMAKMPSLEDYWSRYPDILSGLQIAHYMSRDRFREIISCLHCADNKLARPRKGQAGHDPVWKISELLELFRKKCKELYRPPQRLSVDEAMIRFKGRHYFKQFIKNKPAKWGLKMWMAAAAENGYVVDFFVYTGKDAEAYPSDVGLGGSVVLKLMADYGEVGHIVGMDNLFSGVSLFERLLARKIYAVGTARPDWRSFPFSIAYTKTVNSLSTQKVPCLPQSRTVR